MTRSHLRAAVFLAHICRRSPKQGDAAAESMVGRACTRDCGCTKKRETEGFCVLLKTRSTQLTILRQGFESLRKTVRVSLSVFAAGNLEASHSTWPLEHALRRRSGGRRGTLPRDQDSCPCCLPTSSRPSAARVRRRLGNNNSVTKDSSKHADVHVRGNRRRIWRQRANELDSDSHDPTGQCAWKRPCGRRSGALAARLPDTPTQESSITLSVVHIL